MRGTELLPASPCRYPAHNIILCCTLHIHQSIAIATDSPPPSWNSTSAVIILPGDGTQLVQPHVVWGFLSSVCCDISKNYLRMFFPHKQSLSEHGAGSFCRHHLCFPSAWLTQNHDFNNQLQNRSRYSINHFNSQAAH